MNLCLFTATSHLLEHLTLESIRLHETVIVDTDDSIHNHLQSIGISSVALRSPGDNGWGDRDKSFAGLAMPGVQLADTFLGTNLPLYKVMSIDRLNFWYRGLQAKRQFESIMALEWDVAYVPLDLHNPLPFALMRHSGRKVIGVQISTLRTREWHDLLSSAVPNFSEWKVGRETDRKFLESFGVKADLIEIEPETKTEPPTKEAKAAARKGLGIPDGYNVGLVLFDSQTEWEFRQLIPTLLSLYQLVFVYPIHAYDLRNLQDLGVIGGQIKLTDTLSVESACDEVFLMRYDYNQVKNRMVPVRLLDITGRFLSQELAS